jgi:transposase
MAYGWTKEQEQYLIDNYGKESQRDMSKKLGKSRSTIGNKVKQLQSQGLLNHKPKRTRGLWTEEEQQYLEENIMTMTLDEIAKALDRSYTTIQQRAAKIKKANPEKYDYKPREVVREITECPECGSSRLNDVGVYGTFQAKYFCVNCLMEFDKYGKRVNPML